MRRFNLSNKLRNESRQVKCYSSGTQGPKRKASSLPSAKPVPGKTTTGPERSKPTLDNVELLKTVKFSPIKNLEFKTEESQLLNLFGKDETVNSLVTSSVTAHNKSADGVQYVTPAIQEIVTDRDVCQDIVNALKYNNVLIANLAQYNSLLTKMFTNRLNFIRENNLDGRGSAQKNLKPGDIVNVGGKILIVKEDGSIVPKEE